MKLSRLIPLLLSGIYLLLSFFSFHLDIVFNKSIIQPLSMLLTSGSFLGVMIFMGIGIFKRLTKKIDDSMTAMMPYIVCAFVFVYAVFIPDKYKLSSEMLASKVAYTATYIDDKNEGKLLLRQKSEKWRGSQ